MSNMSEKMIMDMISVRYRSEKNGGKITDGFVMKDSLVTSSIENEVKMYSQHSTISKQIVFEGLVKVKDILFVDGKDEFVPVRYLCLTNVHEICAYVRRSQLKYLRNDYVRLYERIPDTKYDYQYIDSGIIIDIRNEKNRLSVVATISGIIIPITVYLEKLLSEADDSDDDECDNINCGNHGECSDYPNYKTENDNTKEFMEININTIDGKIRKIYLTNDTEHVLVNGLINPECKTKIFHLVGFSEENLCSIYLEIGDFSKQTDRDTVTLDETTPRRHIEQLIIRHKDTGFPIFMYDHNNSDREPLVCKNRYGRLLIKADYSLEVSMKEKEGSLKIHKQPSFGDYLSEKTRYGCREITNIDDFVDAMLDYLYKL